MTFLSCPCAYHAFKLVEQVRVSVILSWIASAWSLKDEDNILDQIYEVKICQRLKYIVLVYFRYALSYVILFNQNLHKKNSNICGFNVFGLNFCLHFLI